MAVALHWKTIYKVPTNIIQFTVSMSTVVAWKSLLVVLWDVADCGNVCQTLKRLICFLTRLAQRFVIFHIINALFVVIIIRLHRSNAAYCYRRSSVVCQSVCLSVGHILSPAKKAVWRADSCGPKEPCIRWDPNTKAIFAFVQPPGVSAAVYAAKGII